MNASSAPKAGLGDLTERINRMAQSLHGKLDDKRALLAISQELRSPLT